MNEDIILKPHERVGYAILYVDAVIENLRKLNPSPLSHIKSDAGLEERWNNAHWNTCGNRGEMDCYGYCVRENWTCPLYKISEIEDNDAEQMRIRTEKQYYFEALDAISDGLACRWI